MTTGRDISVFDYLSSPISAFLNFSFVEIIGSLFFWLILCSRSLRIESRSCSASSSCYFLKISSRVRRNFYLVSLRISCFLSYFFVSRGLPSGMLSSTTSFIRAGLTDCDLQFSKYGCLRILSRPFSTREQLVACGKHIAASLPLDRWLPWMHRGSNQTSSGV